MTNANRTEAQSSLWMEGRKILSTCSSSLPVFKRCNPGIRQAGSLGAAQQVGCVCSQQQQPLHSDSAKPKVPALPARAAWPSLGCPCRAGPSAPWNHSKNIAGKTPNKLGRAAITVILQINQMYIMSWGSRQENRNVINVNGHTKCSSVPLIVSIVSCDCVLKEVKFC